MTGLVGDFALDVARLGALAFERPLGAPGLNVADLGAAFRAGLLGALNRHADGKDDGGDHDQRGKSAIGDHEQALSERSRRATSPPSHPATTPATRPRSTG